MSFLNYKKIILQINFMFYFFIKRNILIIIKLNLIKTFKILKINIKIF
jgi:hypothetical protein